MNRAGGRTDSLISIPVSFYPGQNSTKKKVNKILPSFWIDSQASFSDSLIVSKKRLAYTTAAKKSEILFLGLLERFEFRLHDE